MITVTIIRAERARELPGKQDSMLGQGGQITTYAYNYYHNYGYNYDK